MVSSQAHNLNKGVRFALLQMFYISCSIILFLLVALKNRLKDYWNYLTIFMTVVGVLFFQTHYGSFYTYVNISDWKLNVVVIIMVLFLFTKWISEDTSFEVSALTLLLLLGALMVVASEHLVIIYLAIELQTFCVFVLIAKNKSSLKGAEAALKYFILGAVSSGVLLLGISLLLYEGFPLSIEGLRSDWTTVSALSQTGILLIVVALIFKLAAAPFHFWIPDIYEGSSWSIIAIISTITKISVIVVLQQISFNVTLLGIIVIGSLIVGTFGALNQSKLKRLLGYSGINHMGFILIGLLVLGTHGYESMYGYLVIYFLLMFSILGLAYLDWGAKDIFLVELGLYHNTNKILAFSWGVIFLSIAGIPPLSGFFSKWLMIVLLADNGYLLTILVALLVSAIGAGYYLRVVKINYFQKQSSYMIWNYALTQKKESQLSVTLLIGLTLYVSLFLILNPQPLLSNFLLSCCLM